MRGVNDQGEPLNIRLDGAPYEPTAPSYQKARDHEKRLFWRRVGIEAKRLKSAELAAGVDVRGRKFKAVKPGSRPDGAGGPPLSPHDWRSRSRRLLAMNSTDRGCVLFWRSGWARIMGFHAYKHGKRSLPVRNAIGLTPADELALARYAARAWAEIARARRLA